MRRPFLPFAILAALALSITPPLAAQGEADPITPDAVKAPKATDAEVPEWQMSFENLSPEDRQRYGELLMRATTLFNQKRIFEALNAANEAEAIFENNPAIMNLKGACHVEFRSFEKARGFFNKALVLSPGNVSVLFNLAEMDFVTHMWQDCHDNMAALIPLLDPKAVAMRRLVEFKLMLALIKLDRVAEARELSKKHDFLDDTPFYYYAQAAIEYHDDNPSQAEQWLGSARRVFRKPETLAPWQDTLIEYGYIKSFYGGDLSDDSPPELP